MTDLVRGTRPVAACIARRLARIGAPLTPEQYERMVAICATKQDYTPMWQRSEDPHARRERERARRKCRGS